MKNILKNILSIKNQRFKNIEHLIVDNLSKDKTLSLIKKNKHRKIKVISAADKGIYDALNKGIKKAKGDIISILHSDDFYFSRKTLETIAEIFIKEDVDAVYGDLIYISKNTNKPIRYWKSNIYKKGLFKKGWSPPHPSLFLKRSLFKKFGYFKLKFGNSADFELMRRFIEQKKIKTKYINKVLVVMKYGGKSNKNFTNILQQNLEVIKILGIQKNIYRLSKLVIFKFTNRVFQFLNIFKKIKINYF